MRLDEDPFVFTSCTMLPESKTGGQYEYCKSTLALLYASEKEMKEDVLLYKQARMARERIKSIVY